MGHITLKQYEKLRHRLDRSIVGAPHARALHDILAHVFTSHEADIAYQMPFGFSSTRRLSRITGVAEAPLQTALETMASKGLVFDVERKNRNYWYLNPLVVGIFEFTMMRTRTDFDQKAVGKLIYEYLFEDPSRAFLKELAVAGETQLFRPLVHEDTVKQGYAEVLDWEKATHLIESAGAWTVGLCHCRHVARHRDEECVAASRVRDEPIEVCLSFGEASKHFVRRGTAKEISKQEAMDILVESRELGCVQLGDNVQERPMFICNCCSCCCEVLKGYRMVRDQGLVLSSNFAPEVDHQSCNACALCVKACPVDALSLSGEKGEQKLTLDIDACLGCGVCATRCNRGALEMVRRERRIHTPRTTLERVITMGLERGKLQNLLFDNPDNVNHEVLRRFLGVLLTLPPAKRLLASKQLKSRFVKFLMGAAKGKPGADA
jgi:Pyruvate/2-oxoacid:ferredoxin oxidoreductase delta subunit